MPAETLNCPMCGAPASSDSTCCEHCGARLATVACPACFGMIFVGAKFCSHCGAKVDRTELSSDTHEFCPRCRTEMQAVLVGKTHLEECPKCEGIWADTDSVQQICTDSEEQSAVLGMPTAHPVADADLDLHVHYIPCPVCKELMNRVNFAHCSGVIVNVCNRHGTWFDRDELRRIVEFVRAGGMERARTEEKADLEQAKIQARAASMIVPDTWSGSTRRSAEADLLGLGVSAVALAVRAFLRK
jgi:Zn-finger nucleic acid-binding protein